jgi:UDP-glucose 4-epimerase
MTIDQDYWLITGGAGYIGSHVADLFLAEDKQVIIYDSLSKGRISRVHYLEQKHQKSIPLIVADIRDSQKFKQVLQQFNITGIIHTAGLKAVDESFLNKKEYFDVNLKGTVNILELAKGYEVRKFIFSSTAAVYGDIDISYASQENHKTKPISPYAESKLLAEAQVTDFLKVEGNIGASLRFFNVVGMSNTQLRDISVDNLIPIIINQLKEGASPTIFGRDYPTEDGTCVRDFVDVRDIARAHHIISNVSEKIPPIFNLGTGVGASVLEVINLILEISMQPNIGPTYLPRRKGDPPSVTADVKLADSILGFRTQYTLRESIESIVLQTS